MIKVDQTSKMLISTFYNEGDFYELYGLVYPVK